MLAEFYNSKFNVGSVCPVLIRYLYYNIWPTTGSSLVSLNDGFSSVFAWKASTSVGSSLVICIIILVQLWPSVGPIKYLYYNVGPVLAQRWFIVVWLAECWYLFQWLESKCWANVKPTIGDYVGPMNKITVGQR